MSSIVIDFDGIEGIVTSARIVSEEVLASRDVVNTISEHDNWNCKERDQLIEIIEQVKNGYNALAEFSDDFSTILLQLKSDFENFDKTIPNRFAYLNTNLGNTYAIKTAESTTNAGSGVETVAKNIAAMPVSGGMENYALANSTVPIQVCSYSEVGLQ